jgi:DNA-directed RNA polymerase subunit E'/Rpb7
MYFSYEGFLFKEVSFELLFYPLANEVVKGYSNATINHTFKIQTKQGQSVAYPLA